MQYKLTIKEPVYEFSCEVYFSDNVEPLINKILKKEKLELLDGKVYGYFINSTSTVHRYYVLYSLKNLNINTIVHEVSHLIDGIFQDRDMPFDGEPRAYLTGYITQTILDFTFKKQIKISKWLKYEESK